MPPSKLDSVYRSLLLAKFFCKGWGEPKNLQRLFEFRKVMSNRETCSKLLPKDYPIEITKEENTSDCKIIEGKFLTPLELFLPGLIPEEAKDAHFQMILPHKWQEENYKPICLHLAGTGDHYFWRRRNLIARPLMKEAGLGAIILENPFYGMRKPADQRASSLHNVSDIVVMGGCLILESLVLFNWCEKMGFGPLGITGLSMGGHMASLAATNYPKPLVLVPCLSWSTASSVFTEGVMSHSISWDVLETQYFADGQYREKLSKMVTIVDDSFIAGKLFIQNFNQSMKELKEDIKDTKQLTMKAEKINLSVINETNPEIAKKKFLEINGKSNKLNLSEELLNKLLSGQRIELTASEINELNEKIKIALKRLKKDKSLDKNKNEIVEEQAKLTINNGDKKSVADKACLQSDTSTNESSTVISSAYNLSKTKLMNYLVPEEKLSVSVPAKRQKLDISKTNWWEKESLQFMRGMMDECTHLKNFSVPYDTSLIIAVCAKDDAYVPREGCSNLEDIWPGAEVRYLNAGHVSAYVLHQKLFRSSIIEAFERSKKLWLEEKEREKEKENRAITYCGEIYASRFGNETKHTKELIY
ncbi:CLUMA_CG003741, isoform A [Clunio marinus]|uniref:CLUMA_CG003741, isoform A n=2 Tax=Clunio marinus TaxID=568069 RepID=A0A1J1HPN6_9DIPT|nr:CLUMA_CG003741, isoform A [Clunio marinus]